MNAQLALEGGKPLNTQKFPMWPSFEAATIEKAMEPLRSGKVNYWTGGVGVQFEEAFARWCGTRHAISTTNGTSALHTAVAALGIGPETR